MNHLDQTLTLWLNGSDSIYLDRIAITVTSTTTWIPLMLLLLYIIIRHNSIAATAETILAIALCILLADQVASSVCKPLFARYRPAQNPLLMYTVDVVNGYRGGLYGFFSSHAANTFAAATFLSQAFKYRRASLWLYSWALANCWSRVYLGVHYVGDLMVGAAWGTLVGWGIYMLWHRYGHHTQFWCKACTATATTADTAVFTSGGYNTKSLDALCAAIALTYLTIAFVAL